MKGRFQLASYAKFNRPDPHRDWNWLRPHTLNSYEYYSNNPVNNWGPTGLFGEGSRDGLIWTTSNRGLTPQEKVLKNKVHQQGQINAGRNAVELFADTYNDDFELVTWRTITDQEGSRTAGAVALGIPSVSLKFIRWGKGLLQKMFSKAPFEQAVRTDLSQGGEFLDNGTRKVEQGPSPAFIDPGTVAGSTSEQVNQIAIDSGLIPKGPDPMNGKGAYVDPVTGKQRVLIHDDHHVNNPKGERLNEKGKVVQQESKEAHLPRKADLETEKEWLDENKMSRLT